MFKLIFFLNLLSPDRQRPMSNHNEYIYKFHKACSVHKNSESHQLQTIPALKHVLLEKPVLDPGFGGVR